MKREITWFRLDLGSLFFFSFLWPYLKAFEFLSHFFPRLLEQIPGRECKSLKSRCERESLLKLKSLKKSQVKVNVKVQFQLQSGLSR